MIMDEIIVDASLLQSHRYCYDDKRQDCLWQIHQKLATIMPLPRKYILHSLRDYAAGHVWHKNEKAIVRHELK